MERTKELQNFIDKFTKKSFGFSHTEAMAMRICVFCCTPIRTEDFRDELSLKEYKISGLCQKCQDDTFGR